MSLYTEISPQGCAQAPVDPSVYRTKNYEEDFEHALPLCKLVDRFKNVYVRYYGGWNHKV